METPKRTFRVRVMKTAWHLFKTGRYKWRECMLRAWSLYRLAKSMGKRVVKFAYVKGDGSRREARGILRGYRQATDTFRQRKSQYSTQIYYDIEKGAFRSFKVENYLGLLE